jgi:hypothetical protein
MLCGLVLAIGSGIISLMDGSGCGQVSLPTVVLAAAHVQAAVSGNF